MRFFALRSLGSFRSALLLAGLAVFLLVSAPPKNDFSCFCLFPDSCLFLGFGFPLFKKLKNQRKKNGGGGGGGARLVLACARVLQA